MMRASFLLAAPFVASVILFSPLGCAGGGPGGGFVSDEGSDAGHAGDRTSSPNDARAPVPDGGADGAADESDAGSPTDADAAASSDDAATVDASDGGSDAAVVVVTDPFDTAACSGAPITFAELAAKFPAGAHVTSLGTYTLMKRTRSCDAVTGCSAWGDAVQATASPSFGSFDLGGSLNVQTEGSQLAVTPRDASSTCSYCRDALTFLSSTTSGPMTFPTDLDNYHYTRFDDVYIPPSPIDEVVSGTFSLTMTDDCAQVIGFTKESMPLTEFAFLVRY